MNEIFNFHGQEVRTLTIDNEPWFVGKDVADILGYSKARNAIALHVDEEDALKQGIPTSGGTQDMLIINESGLYSLILSSKLPQAKEFKRWVTSEVLPAIRKQGGFIREDLDEMLSSLCLLDRRSCVSNKRLCWKILTTSRVSNRFILAMLNHY